MDSPLKKLREAVGLTQPQLARVCRDRLPDCKLNKVTISRWERGERRLDPLIFEGIKATVKAWLTDDNGKVD